MSSPENWSRPVHAENTGFSPEALARSFQSKLERLSTYTARERGAFILWQRITEANIVQSGESPMEDTIPYSLSKWVFHRPINYDPVPEDSTQQRQIVLTEHHSVVAEHPKVIVPSLHVFTLEAVEEDEEAVAEKSFSREDFGFICRPASPASIRFVAAMLGDDEALIAKKVAAQAEYVTWLGRAAESLDMPPAYEIFVPRPALSLG